MKTFKVAAKQGNKNMLERVIDVRELRTITGTATLKQMLNVERIVAKNLDEIRADIKLAKKALKDA